ncbi:nuclear cap-binding protein subunit 2-like [Clavelina lepadiformis]|uniref:Nuclear cap-binding protein subunit 2 n=1 Tax=Clavelina lepadiformis TaxID=159417 RepID=A0ABP0H1X9_CLALP
MSVDINQNAYLRPILKDPGVELTAYRDQHFKGDRVHQEKLLQLSTTLYVGNLSYFTTEEQIYELFSKCGDLKRVVMGLDKFKKTPCGFCFVEYYDRVSAEDCVRFINGTRLDDRVVRTDWDAGFKEGRQYGRGKAGGQVRDEYRQDFDPGRGGFGVRAQLKTDKQTSGPGAETRERERQGNLAAKPE